MPEPTSCCSVVGGYCDRCDLLVGLDGLRVTGVARDERAALAWSFFYFFALLCAYGLLRPLREEMGV